MGSHLARALSAAGHPTVLISRGTRSHQLNELPLVESREADIVSGKGLAAALEGCQAVAHCAGIAFPRGSQTFRAVHVTGTHNVVEAAHQTGVSKVVLTSFLRARPHRSPYHQTKWEAEELVRSSGLDHTILKIGVIYGEGDQFTTQLKRVLRLMPVFAKIGTSEQTARPLAVEDLVKVMLAALVEDRLSKTTVPVVGPEELAISEMVRRIGRQVGRKTLVLPLPLFAHRLLAGILEKLMPQPLVTKAQVVMLSEGLSTAAPECEALPQDLLPVTGFLN